MTASDMDCGPTQTDNWADADLSGIMADLDPVDRCAMRRHYRNLRIAIYAPQSSEYAANGMCQGWYGMSRDDAKAFLKNFYCEIAWHQYLGSK